MIYVRINVDGGLFSATHCRRDAGDAMGCGCVTVRCACVIGEGTAGTGIRVVMRGEDSRESVVIRCWWWRRRRRRRRIGGDGW
jgi:hypothetical protein